MRKLPFHMLVLFSLLMLAACSSISNAGQSPSPTSTQAPKPLNVYVSTADAEGASQHAVYALSGTDGKVLWNYASQVSLDNAPVLDNGVAYVGSNTGLDALNTQDGKLLWSYQTTGFAEVLGVVHGVVYGASDASGNAQGSSSIFALNASDGSVRWKYQSPDLLSGGAMLADGAIYATVLLNHSCHCSDTPDYHLALNASDGSVLWKTPQATDIYNVQMAANGLVYGIDGMTDVFASTLLVRKASDGSVVWQYPNASTSALVSIIGMDGNVIYVLSNDGDFSNFPTSGPNVVYALKASDGTVLWRSQIADTDATVATLLNKVVYLGSHDGAISALNAADGKLLWHAQVGQAATPNGSGTAIAVVVNGTVYLAFGQGFAALNASDGSLKWQYQASGVLSISAVANGVVYASSRDSDITNPGHNKIYALHASDGSLLWRYDAPSTFYTPVVG